MASSAFSLSPSFVLHFCLSFHPFLLLSPSFHTLRTLSIYPSLYLSISLSLIIYLPIFSLLSLIYLSIFTLSLFISLSLFFVSRAFSLQLFSLFSRQIYDYGQSWNEEEFIASIRSHDELSDEMEAMRDFQDKLEKLNPSHAIGVFSIEARGLKTSLVPVTENALASMKKLLLQLTREHVSSTDTRRSWSRQTCP